MLEKNRQVLRVDLAERSYDILIGRSILDVVQELAVSAGRQHAVIVSNETVAPLYQSKLLANLQKHYQQVDTILLPDGEKYKSWESLQQIFTSLLKMQADRKTILYALGGGVIGDITGFAAACYMRGIPYVQVPTTLLSQVDSSVGGKTAINHPLGKNMIGAFYQPKQVLIDTETLKTLPPRELRAGIAEVIKYGPIFDMVFFEWLEQHTDSLLQLDEDAVSKAIYRSCEIKAEVVAQDETESGLRAILNFGHTFGHAIEVGAGYGTFLHGEAVAIGMVMASDLSCRMGFLSQEDAERIRVLIQRAGLPTRGPAIDPKEMIRLMKNDKKTVAGEIQFVLLQSLGQTIVTSAPEKLVEEVIRANQV